MILGICELLWLKITLDNIQIKWNSPIRLYCENKSTINMAHNRVQHDRTKHVEVDKHFIKEKLDSGRICTPFVPTSGQVASIFTKRLSNAVCHKLTSKLGMEDIHSPA